MAVSRGLLQELGHIGLVWAQIEQSMILSLSALTSQDYAGVPSGDLRSDFKRLREAWWRESAKRLPTDLVDKTLNPLNMRLAEAAKMRGNLMHGTWMQTGRGRFTWRLWEQRKALTFREVPLTLGQVREIRVELERLRDDYESAVT